MWTWVAIIAGLFAALLLLQFFSMAMGVMRVYRTVMRQLDDVAKKLDDRQPVTAEEISDLARKPELRPRLYELLKHHEKLDLFPSKYSSIEAQGEGNLAQWLMHPNEFGDAPAEIELVETVHRIVDGKNSTWAVYRFKMPEKHSSAKHGWLLGFAGPFFEGDRPFSDPTSDFSRCSDKEGAITPDDLIDWWLNMMIKKRVIKTFERPTAKEDTTGLADTPSLQSS